MNGTVGADESINLNDLLNGKFLENDRLNQRRIIQKVENILHGWRKSLAEDGDSPCTNDSTVEQILASVELDPLETASIERPRVKQRTSRWAHSVPSSDIASVRQQLTDVSAPATAQIDTETYNSTSINLQADDLPIVSKVPGVNFSQRNPKPNAPAIDGQDIQSNPPVKTNERPGSGGRKYTDTGSDRTRMKQTNVRRSRPPRKMLGSDVHDAVPVVDGKRFTDGPIKPKQRWRSGGHAPQGNITAPKPALNNQKRPFTGAVAAKHLWNLLNNVNAENKRMAPSQQSECSGRGIRPWAPRAGRVESNNHIGGGCSNSSDPCSSDLRCCDLTGCNAPKEKKDVEIQHPPVNPDPGLKGSIREIVARNDQRTDFTTVIGDNGDHDEQGDHRSVREEGPVSEARFMLGRQCGKTARYGSACRVADAATSTVASDFEDRVVDPPDNNDDIYQRCSKIGTETALNVLRSPQVVIADRDFSEAAPALHPFMRYARFHPPLRAAASEGLSALAPAVETSGVSHRPAPPSESQIAPEYASLYYGDPSPSLAEMEPEVPAARPNIAATGIDVTEDVLAIGKHLSALEYTWEGKIDRFFSSRLVGKGGWNIKSFTQTSGADIQIGRLTDEKDRHAILISGTHSQIVKALELVTRQFPDLDLSIEFEFEDLPTCPRSKQLYLPYCFPVIVKVHSVISSDQISIQPRFLNDHYWRLKLETSLQSAYSQGDISTQKDIPMNLALLHHTYSCWAGPNTISLTDVYSEPFSDLQALHIPLISPVKNGMVCAVKIGLMWCRAIVVKECPAGTDIRVRLVDYGGEITVNENQLKHLRIDFHGLAFLCIDVTLKGLQLNKNQQMETLVRNCVKIGETYVCVVRGFDENAKPSVDLFKFGGKKFVLVNSIIMTGRTDMLPTITHI